MRIVQPVNNYEDQLYNYLLTHWDKNVSSFKLWLQKVCGVKVESELYIEIEYLIESENELKDWISTFDGDIDNLFETTEKYKEERYRSARQTFVTR